MNYNPKKHFWSLIILLILGLAIPTAFCQPLSSNLMLAKNLSDAYVEVTEKVKSSVVTIECINLYVTPTEEEDNSAETAEVSPEEMLPAEVHRFLSRMQEESVDEVNPGSCTGTGVIISTDGVVVTNYHVVKDAISIKVKLDNSKQLEAEVIGLDPKTDLAVLQLNTKEKLPAATLGDYASCKVGSIVIAIGAPEGFEQSVTFGHISALQRSSEDLYYLDDLVYLNFIQTDAAINHGNSGGPLVTLDGEVIGINCVGADNADNLNFAIPVSTVKNVVKKILKFGEVPRGYMGVSTYELRNFNNGTEHQGLLIQKVHPNTPAAAAGLKMGDILLSYNGTKLESNQQIMRLVSNSEIGSQATIKYLRNGQPRSTQTTITDQPANPDRPAMELIAPDNAEYQRPESYESELLGITAIALPLKDGFPDDVEFFKDKYGLLITAIDNRLSAYTSGLIPGMIIKLVNFTPVNTLADLEQVEKKITPASEVLIQALLTTDIPITSILDLSLYEKVKEKYSSD